MNYKHRAVLSSYSDLSKISSCIKIIHFRKFISKRILKIILESCPSLIVISISKYASKRLNPNILSLISDKRIELRICSERGRPNMLRNINVNYKLIKDDLNDKDNFP